MPKVQTGFVVNRSVEDVFSYLASFENRLEYEEALVGAEQTSEGPFGLGTTGKDAHQAMGRRMESTARITAFDPNKSFTFESMTGPMEYRGTWTVESAEGGTRVSFEMEGHMKGIMRLFEPLMAMQFKGQMARSTAKLKDILESRN